MGWGLRIGRIATVGVLALTGASAAFAGTRPPLKPTKLSACLQLRGGLRDQGTRSVGFSYGVDQDPNVVALAVVSGKNPRPGLSTSIVTKGRRPVLTELFANVRLDAYVFHRNGITPRAGAMAAAKKFVSQTIAACVKAAR